MSNFAENLRRVIFEKRLKAADVARATKITPPTISRYLSGTHQPTTDNLIVISKYLGVFPEALLSSSGAPESSGSSRYISSATDPLLKQIEDKNTIINLLERMVAERDGQVTSLTDEVRNLKAQVDMLKAQNDQWKASSQDRHAKGKAKADLAIAKDKKRKPKK